MVGGKKRRKGGGRERSEKDTLAFLLPDRRAHPTSSFSNSPSSNHLNLYYYIKPILYRILLIFSYLCKNLVTNTI
ncbi:hypothetical protein, partial [Aneurinibacillus migulanus]